MITIRNLRTQYLVNPLGIDAQPPRLSWQIAGEGRGILQSAYQIQVAATPACLEQADEMGWDSGKVHSDQTASIAYAGATLQSRQRVYWRVRAWDQNDQASDWSESTWWEMGLLEQNDWTANWIEPDWVEKPGEFKLSPFLRGQCKLNWPIQTARLYITAHGLYEAWLNGSRLGDQLFTPGFTPYDRRLQYQVYDVTAALLEGENILGAVLGDGWYRGSLYAFSSRNVYGKRLGLLAQLIVEMRDGQIVTFGTSSEWKATCGPILKSDMKEGETYDARLELPGWCSPGYDDRDWKGVRTPPHPKIHLVASLGVPVSRHETFHPTVLKTPNGQTVLDFGQNLAGVVRFRVRGQGGDTLRLRHGEALDRYGNFTLSNLGRKDARAMDKKPFQEVRYTLKGGGVEEYEPHFTVHGFRYVQVDGYPAEVDPADFQAVAIYSDLPPGGTFECSEPLVNRLHQNVEWSMKSNFLDIPTDCPTRERAGWTGDAQIFSSSACFLRDMRAFFSKWLADLRLEQEASGKLGNFVPNPFRLSRDLAAAFFNQINGSAGWGDAAVLVPWALYWAYGDIQFLEQQYASMKAWVDYVAERIQHVPLKRLLHPRYWFDRRFRARQKLLWDTGYHWGEWLEPGEGTTDGWLRAAFLGSPRVPTAYLVHSAHILAKTARLLEKPGDAERYLVLSERVKTAYVEEYLREDGRILPEKQASYVRVLAFDLAPETLKPTIAEHLVRLVRARGNHIGTGFLSTGLLCPTLTENGHLDVTYDLLMQTTNPSWLYAVTRGATTIWETWEGVDADGNPHDSLNHYSPGAVVNFLHCYVAGIQAGEPGYRRILIHPRPGGKLTWAKANHESIHGLISVEWRIGNGQMQVTITIPPNTRATVTLPGARIDQVVESGTSLAEAEGVSEAVQEGEDLRLEVGSGEYRFGYPYSL